MTTQVFQTKNLNEKFTYTVNNTIAIENSKKDYSFALVAIDPNTSKYFIISMMTKFKQSELNFWTKNGNPKSMVIDSIKIIDIKK